MYSTGLGGELSTVSINSTKRNLIAFGEMHPNTNIEKNTNLAGYLNNENFYMLKIISSLWLSEQTNFVIV